MRIVLCVLLLAPAVLQAQIYRCDTEQGPVFSDERCGDEAQLVTLEEESSGLGGGPPQEVRTYLQQQREQRAKEREESAERARQRPLSQPAPIVIESPSSPAWPAWQRPLRPQHPIHRPDRPGPSVPAGEPGSGGSVLRPKQDGEG